MSCLHRGPFIQRGRGIGSTLSAVFKDVVPAVKVMGQKVVDSPITQKVVKTAKRSALEAGLNVATDVLEGRDFEESLSQNVSTAKRAVKDSLKQALNEAKVSRKTGAKKARLEQSTVVATTRKRKGKNYGDLFDEKFT
jgi:hypothetical protein